MGLKANLSVLMITLTLNTLPAAGADLLPIDRGYYVISDTACGQASNATITLYDGASFGSAHAECRKPAVRKRPDGSYQITTQCRDMQGRGGPWTKLVDTYVVQSQTEFTLTNPYGKFHYRYCKQSDLPEPWSKNRISDSTY